MTARTGVVGGEGGKAELGNEDAEVTKDKAEDVGEDVEGEGKDKTRKRKLVE